ncbi:hypothetical protein EZV62_009073 [Acer yangbiense]|uniref:Cyclic nucleotide-binding domain-containing protein n=1 Tax=Acer yangbiense TaxID=1000413 RepID=A0A5C7IFI3_9ROSI|nr:hypothetical protein EZV62_009073 [Acer yangbiense]
MSTNCFVDFVVKKGSSLDGDMLEEFRTWSIELLHELCDCAKPVSYAEHAEIVRRGSSIDEMLFLVQGKLRTYSFMSADTGSAGSPPHFEISINHLKDSEFCGKNWLLGFKLNVFIKHQTSTQVQEPPVESQPPQAPPPPAESLAQQLTSGI